MSDKGEIILIIIGSLLCYIVVSALFYCGFKRKARPDEENGADSRGELRRALMDYQSQTSKDMREMSDAATKNTREQFSGLEKRIETLNEKVEARLKQGYDDNVKTLTEIAAQVKAFEAFQKKILDLSEGMMSLQTILSDNQKRGAFGEFQLGQILYSVYGDNRDLYREQYKLSTGSIVDVALFMPRPNGLIGVDSKFPFVDYANIFAGRLTKEEEATELKEFKKEMKKHVKDIADRYIVSGETVDYAAMFVPSDGILALLHTKCPDIVSLAQRSRVLIVSPTTIVALLQTYKLIYVDYERSKNVKMLGESLNKLSGDFAKLTKSWTTLYNDIDKAYTHASAYEKSVKQLTATFQSVADAEQSIAAKETKTEEN